jgi:hypothetical protein
MSARKEADESIASGQCSEELSIGATLRKALAWIFDDGIFGDLKLHGNTKWLPVTLVTLAVFWVWSAEPTLTGAFREAARWTKDILGDLPITTYQGLTAALMTWTSQLLPLLRQRLQKRMHECGGEQWRVSGWVALAVDGTRVSTPRSVSNEQAFCAPNFGKSKTAKYRKKKRRPCRRKQRPAEPVKPQMWLTLVWHMGLGLPWTWKSGPSHACERDHFRALLEEQEFPENTLFCADAGFTGYDLWRDILAAGHSFLIRVGANVRLLRRLGYVREFEGLVYFWPDKAARKKKLPPLVLRLWQVQLGRCVMSLVTNVLDDEKMAAAQVKELYRRRWGIELQFRTLKQTFGRRKLRSKSPKRAYAELDWSLLGLWMIQLFAVKERIKLGEPPTTSSAAMAIRIMREMLDRQHETTPPERELTVLLGAAATDNYQRKRSKRARYRPNYKDKPAAGAPKIFEAQAKDKRDLRKYQAFIADQNR